MKRLLIVLTLLLLTGCTKTVYLDQDGNKIEPPQEEKIEWWIDDKFEVVDRFNSNYSGTVYEVRDVETGVHYFLYLIGYNGGISPVYESDGSIRVTHKE